MLKQRIGIGHAVITAIAASVLAVTPCRAGDPTHTDLAKQTQNPVANLISVPLQNNSNFGLGSQDRTQNVLNIQPVIPVNLGAVGLKEWNLINRTIIPLVYQPTGSTGGDLGLSDINHSMFFSPAKPGRLIWGGGPIISLPTSVNDRVGPRKLSFGPTAVALMMPGHWVIGALANNLWSVAGDSNTPDVNSFLLQYFINYNLPHGWYLSTAPTLTANWEAPSGEQWTVPVGGGFGKVFRLGAQPMNLSVRGYWNADKPTGGADTTLQIQLSFLFPK